MVALKDQLNRPLRTMAEYARGLLHGDVPKPIRHHGALPRVHFFGLSQISPLHVRLLSRLKFDFDIHIYSLNPSREYWEDIQTPSEKKWIKRHGVDRLKPSEAEWSSGDLFAEPDHALLSAWGKPGRESIRLLCQLTDYDFQAGFAAAARRDTLLGAIGQGLLTLEAPDGASLPMAQDTSLQISACPGIRREVETVYNSILYNLEADPDLRMTDIAVMVSDMSRYKPVIDAVFSRRPARITYNLVDSNARTESVFAQAVLAVVELARGNFSRKQVFDLLRNPCVMQRWGYGSEALSIWIAWADGLGIFHDYENRTVRGENTPASGLYSWRQGLERLRLARIMTSPAAVDGAPGPHFNGMVPFTDMHTGDERLLEKFCRLVEALALAISALKTASAPARTWRDTFFRVVNQFVEIAPDRQGEETVFQSLVAAFDHFVRYDELARLRPARPLTAEALWAFVRAHLEGITGGQGDYLTGGVTVSALMPMRPIPFKVVYVMGLEEGRFPGRVPASLLDLRNRKRRIGDITPAERNRYLFLEVLISVSHKLYLSYVSQDLQKDRDLEPCSVVHQLRRYVERQLLGGQPFRIARIPMKADSPLYIAPEAVNAGSDVLVNGDTVQRLSCYRRSGLWPAFERRATPAQLATAARYRPDLSLPDAAAEDDPLEAGQLTVNLLRRFLLDPVELVARYHLGIGEQTDPTAELAEMEDEPLASQFPIDFRLRTTALHRWLLGQLSESTAEPATDPLEAEFDGIYADLSRKSLVPAGAFAGHDQSKLKQQVMGVGERLLPLVMQMHAARRLYFSVALGTVMDDFVATGDAHSDFNPLVMEMPAGGPAAMPQTVRIDGAVPWVWQDGEGDWHCLVVTGANRKSKFPDKYVIGPLLTLMAICAGDDPSPWSDGARLRLHVSYREHVSDFIYRLDPVRALEYLGGLVEDFFTPSPLLWLPFETVFTDRNLRALIAADDVDELDREAFGLSMREYMQAKAGMIAQLSGAAVTADVLDRARRRFRVFLPERNPA
jgi:exonuclease V gamma subunit